MWDVIIVILTVIALLVLVELLDLPDWIGRKLRGQISSSEIEEKVRSLESRVSELERKLSGKK